MVDGSTALANLLDLQIVDESAEKTTLTSTPSTEVGVRSFGGQLIAQGLLAAGLTVDRSRMAHSMHQYFLRPGIPELPITFEVTHVRDGRSFSIRHVTAQQNEKTLFTLSASFHIDEPGLTHQTKAPSVPLPYSLDRFEDRFTGRADMDKWFTRAHPFDIRYTGSTPFDVDMSGDVQQVWMKTNDALSDDPLVHRVVLAYLSDIAVLDPVLMAHDVRWTDRPILGASLDHALWFHQPFRADEWLLFDHESPVSGGGRGLARALVWTLDGRLVASFVQEGLMRPPANFA